MSAPRTGLRTDPREAPRAMAQECMFGEMDAEDVTKMPADSQALTMGVNGELRKIKWKRRREELGQIWDGVQDRYSKESMH